MRFLRALAQNWQPVAVILGANLAICGITATTSKYLGVWPAVAVCGALVCGGALLWGRLTVVEGE